MKNRVHAIAGVVAFLCIIFFVGSTLFAMFFGDQGSVVSAKGWIFKGVFLLILASLIAGASGVSLLGKRTDSLALMKQKRGPIAFMTSLIVLLPSAYFLLRWASVGSFGLLYYVVQALELVGSFVVFSMVGLNIRDGLKLTGRVGSRKAVGKNPSIEERDGGPLIAMAIPVLKDGKGGEALSKKPVAALCRCGASKNKPFCDGSHSEIDFDSHPSNNRTKDKVFTYEGEEITVHYNRLLCSHAQECGKRHKAAFVSSRKPWIAPDNASAKEIVEIVKACPSGALRYSFPGEKPSHVLADEVAITIEKNGPYRIAGIPLASSRLAKGASSEKYVLCRCGASKNKPYCDGSHVDVGWSDAQ